jgi:hypothetical protein
LDYICGHAPATVGREYGAPELKDMARVIEISALRGRLRRQFNDGSKKDKVRPKGDATRSCKLSKTFVNFVGLPIP